MDVCGDHAVPVGVGVANTYRTMWFGIVYSKWLGTLDGQTEFFVHLLHKKWNSIDHPEHKFGPTPRFMCTLLVNQTRSEPPGRDLSRAGGQLLSFFGGVRPAGACVAGSGFAGTPRRPDLTLGDWDHGMDLCIDAV